MVVVNLMAAMLAREVSGLVLHVLVLVIFVLKILGANAGAMPRGHRGNVPSKDHHSEIDRVPANDHLLEINRVATDQASVIVLHGVKASDHGGVNVPALAIGHQEASGQNDANEVGSVLVRHAVRDLRLVIDLRALMVHARTVTGRPSRLKLEKIMLRARLGNVRLNGHARVLDQDKVIVRHAVKGGVLVIDHPEVTGHHVEVLVIVRHVEIVQKLANVRRVVKEEVLVIDHHEVIGHHAEVLVIVRSAEIVQKAASVRHFVKDEVSVIDHQEVTGRHAEVLATVRHVGIVQKLASVRHALNDGTLVRVLRGHQSALAGNVLMAGAENREDRAVHLPSKGMTSTA